MTFSRNAGSTSPDTAPAWIREIAASTACSGGDSDPHCRIYLVHDSSGAFNALHVVDSPAAGDWGPNLINQPAEYLSDHPTWRVFRFEAGRTFDHRLVYRLGTETGH